MALLRISRTAKADLASILATSLENWGESGRDRYAALLATAMQRTAAAPLGPMTKARRDLRPDMRSFHIRHVRHGHGVGAPVHVLYYRASADSIEILRILHERMEPQRHLGAPMKVSRARRPGRGR
jgi:toxin ParE1/3/4